MKNIIFLIFIFLIIVSNKSVASPTKKIIQVKMPSSIEKLYFFYRDAAFNDQYFVLYNPNKKDTLVSITVELLSGQVIKHSDIVTILGVPTALNQSFIVTDLDTIRFEMDNNRNLNLKGNNGFFVEDIVNVYFEYPGPNNREFLDENNGFSIAKSIFKSNIVAIEKLNKDGRCNKMEYATLLNIVKADYYYRIISWALENQQLEEIEEDIANLQKDLEDIQMVKSSSLVQLFGACVQYAKITKQLDDKDTRGMVNAIIGLGWHKNITFGYIKYILPNVKENRTALTQVIADLKMYLNGDFSEELAVLVKKILPVITNLHKVMLIDFNGRQLTLKQLLDKSPNSYFLIDFWASWCKPCRQEAPLFEAAKKNYSTKNIVFMSLSTDEDNKITEWKKALKDDGLLKAINHYKLVSPKTNLLFENFKVATIPRYILINSKGQFIDQEFPRPSEPEFKKALLKYK